MFMCPNDCAEHLLSSAYSKVEDILKGSLDLISSHSPSVKLQIMGGKVGFGCKAKNIAGRCQQIFCNQKLLDNIQLCFAFTPFPPII